MKKILFLTYAALALFALSCTKEEDLPAPSPNEGKTFVSVGGSRELPDNGTKSQMADNGAFSWTYSNSDENNDAILICGYSNEKYTFSEIACVGYPDPEEKKNARFSGWVTGTIQDYAVFPATLGASFSGTTLTLNLPNEITWKEGEADNLMVAPTRTYANGVHNFSFYNVAGLFKVTLNGLPSTARKVSFYAAKSFAEETPKKITGNFSIDMSAVNVEGTEKVYPQITTETATTDDFVTIKWSDAPAESMVFYVPVPTGEYTGFSFRVKDAEDNVLASFKGKTAKNVTRGKLIILPALTMTTAGGGGDNGGSKLVVPHNYTANNGVFVLPETSSDIELDIESNNEVTIAYSSENAEKKPANVYMTVLGDVNSLTINLPNSHVELGGQVVNNNNYTITNLTSNTSVSTLLVNKTVKIGKSEVEGSGITVTGGSLNLTAPVEGTVKVDIPDNVLNTTEEKVSININSSIQKLDVHHAANKDVANKIYVTLAPPTNQTQEQPVVVALSNLTVTETNCNLYVAPGVTVTTATTSATENTIEGTVTTLTAQPEQGASESTVNVTVTGTVDELTATGEGTIVNVTSDATVSDYISADDGATVIVDSEATVTDNTDDNGGNGTIATVGSGSVAIIGTVNYTTLDSAIEAAESGATINMLKDVEISDKLIVALENKSVTLNLGGNTLTGRVNLTNGNLTVKNGSVKNVNVEGQPLNVYGSSTPGTQNYSVLTIASDVTVEGHYGICVFGATASTAGYGAVVNFAGKIKANDGIFVSGNLGNNIAADMNNVVNVTGKIEGTETGIALNGWATVNVQDGANISANTGIAVKRGVLNVADGATVTGNGTWNPSPNANNNGTELTGAAVSMTNTYNQYGAMAVNIAGGNFTSVNGQALLKADQNYTNAATFTVTGGTFSSDPSAYVADGYQAVKSGNLWTVSAIVGVAAIGDNHFGTLQEAIDAANPGDEIDILKNINLTTVTSSPNENYNVLINKNITINGNNHTITASAGKRALIIYNTQDEVTFKNLTVVNNGTPACLWIADAVTCNLDNVTLDGSNYSEYNQPLTIGPEITDRVNLNVTNGSVIKTNNAGSEHYDIIVHSPSDISIENSVLKGWANVYIKPTGGGSTVNISNTTMQSEGSTGPSNDFGLISIESPNNTITLDHNTAAVSHPGEGTYNTLINISSYWANYYGTNTKGNKIYIKNNTTYTGDGTKYSGMVSSRGWAEFATEMESYIYFDETTYNNFTQFLDGDCVITGPSNGLYTVNYHYEPDVFYYWYEGNEKVGANCKLADPFEGNGYILCNNEYFELLRNITLKEDINCAINGAYLPAGSKFTMLFGDYNITKGNYSIKLATSLSVVTDKQTDIFSAADENATIVETEDNGTYTYSAVSCVASIGTKKYETLADAIAAVPTDGTKTTIQMIANEEVAAGTNLLIAKTKNIVLDLNGYTISGQGGSKTSEFAFIENKGTLEIIDSGTNGTITYRCTDVDPNYGCGYYTVRNSAKLTLSGGRVVNTTVSGASYAIDNTSNAWGIGDDKDAVFTMNGGVISCPSGDQALRVYQNCSENSTPQSHNRVYINGGVILDTGIFLDNYIYSPTTNTTGEGILTTVEINNGEIHGLIDLKLRHAFNTTFTINGGTFANSQLRIRRVDDSVDHNAWKNGISEPTEPIFFITNGNFTFGASNFVTTGWTSYSNQFSITGGTFNVDPSSHVAAGYAATQTGNTWTVEEASGPQYWIDYAAASYESVDETNKVITIANAAQLAKLAKDVRRNESTNYQQVSNFEGYTIRLVADIDLSGKIWFPIGTDNTWSPEEQAAENANPCYNSWFRGTFDGNGYTIRNMHAVHEEHAGLFGCAVYATFTNIKVEDFEIESNHFAGGVIAWIEVGVNAPSITNCTVKNGTITSSPVLVGNAYDNGDKAGGICGFLYTGANRPVAFSGNTVENVNITAYRDFGGLLGYGNYATVSDNTVKNVNLYQNNTNAYKSGTITTFGPEIGRNDNNTSTASNNILTNVKKYTGVPGAYTEVQ